MTIIQRRERPGRTPRSRGTTTFGQGAATGGGGPPVDYTASLLLETGEFVLLENGNQVYLES